jgi:hypothetical protein
VPDRGEFRQSPAPGPQHQKVLPAGMFRHKGAIFMTYTTDSRRLIFDLSMNLLQQDMLTSRLFMGGSVGKSLRDLVLAESGSLRLTDPAAQALSGKLRSDSGMLRQASANVSEAASVTAMAQSAAGTIRSSLERMQELAEGVTALWAFPPRRLSISHLSTPSKARWTAHPTTDSTCSAPAAGGRMKE